MRMELGILAMLLGLFAVHAPRLERAREGERLDPVRSAQLLVTQGELKPGRAHRLLIDAPKVRAVAPSMWKPVAELRFTYLGPTHQQLPLRSGRLRSQVGLKLRAQDTCNVLYVMWHISPTSGLMVSIKHNPGQHTHAECTNRGYKTVYPRRALPLPRLIQGDTHAIRAELNGRELRVYVDGILSWEGTLPREAFTFDGPVGLRSDNGRFEVELLTPSP